MDEWFSLRMPTWALEAALVAEILQGTEHLQVEAGTIVELTGDWPPSRINQLADTLETLRVAFDLHRAPENDEASIRYVRPDDEIDETVPASRDGSPVIRLDEWERLVARVKGPITIELLRRALGIPGESLEEWTALHPMAFHDIALVSSP
jgi:hypothetical protein